MTGTGSRRPGPRGARGPASSRPGRGVTDALRHRDEQPPVTPPTASPWRRRLSAARGDQRTIRYAALAITLVLVAVLLSPTLKAWVDQRNQISDLTDKVAEQKTQVQALQDEQARWEDPAYVEQQARQRLKFVRPGEKSYTVIDGTESAPVAGMADGTTSDHVPWYGTLWSSLRAADIPAGQRP